MNTIHFAVSSPVSRSARVLQLEGLFDVAPAKQSSHSWSVNLPDAGSAWQIGLIVGPSGSGKSTLARYAYGDNIVQGYDWSKDQAVVDGFPAELSIRDITAALSSVGFSSPPSWLKPFHCLSNGEQFRATLARALVDPRPLVVVDEFTSVVDRTVAQIGSAAVSKAVRRSGRKFIAVTCHYDVAEWLQPDWMVEMPQGQLTTVALRRPPITLEVRRVSTQGWDLFKRHHYMTGDHHKSALCFVALWKGNPVAWCSVLSFPHPTHPGWREHRTVVLPDYQGVGIGNRLSEFIASLFVATGKPFRGVTSSPGFTHHRMRSKLWKTIRLPSLGKLGAMASHNKTAAINRLTMAFEYIGPPSPGEAKRLGVI
jgi:ABC-type thiamine transport system ATPase subunit/GNAT superfamily N-acetyltransferase